MIIQKIQNIYTNKILEIVEFLPKFRSGIIKSLQNIRIKQKEYASENLTKRLKPENIELVLNKIVISYTFEFEDFKKIHKSIKSLGLDSKQLNKCMNFIKDSESKLRSTNSYNIGYISNKDIFRIDKTIYSKQIPNFVKLINVRYNRYFPSVAKLDFEFTLNDEITNNLKQIQNKEYVYDIEFHKIFPLNSLGLGHSYRYEKGAKDSINLYLSKYTKLLKKWISNKTRVKSKNIKISSTLFIYSLNVENYKDIKSFINDNKNFLADYEYDALYSNVNENLILVENSYKKLDYKIFKINKSEKISNLGYYEIDFLTTYQSVNSVIDYYFNKIENFRVNIFNELFKKTNRLTNQSNKVIELKFAHTIFQRFSQEFSNDIWNFNSKDSLIGECQKMLNEKTFNYELQQQENYKELITKLNSNFDLLNIGIKDYLEVKNIYVMSKLQNKMFWLSIIVLFTSIVSILLNWDDVETLMNTIKLNLEAFIDNFLNKINR